MAAGAGLGVLGLLLLMASTANSESISVYTSLKTE